MARTPDTISHLLRLGDEQVISLKAKDTPEAKALLDKMDAFADEAEKRDYVYRWTTDDDEIADDAIIVGIGGTSAEMIAAGLTYVEPTASLYWCARVTGKGVIEAGGEMGPWSVPDALLRAHQLCAELGFDRVVVTMEEVGLWRPAWGRLADHEGYR